MALVSQRVKCSRINGSLLKWRTSLSVVLLCLKRSSPSVRRTDALQLSITDSSALKVLRSATYGHESSLWMAGAVALFLLGRHGTDLRSDLVEVSLADVRQHHLRADGRARGVHGRPGAGQPDLRRQVRRASPAIARLWLHRNSHRVVRFLFPHVLSIGRRNLRQPRFTRARAARTPARAQRDVERWPAHPADAPHGRHTAVAGGLVAK